MLDKLIVKMLIVYLKFNLIGNGIFLSAKSGNSLLRAKMYSPI